MFTVNEVGLQIRIQMKGIDLQISNKCRADKILNEKGLVSFSILYLN
jgi:hypothetical protein